MFSISKDDDMVECPYNKYHRMQRKRLQPHLIKCRVSYPDVELCKCPFNATHLVPEPEFTHHCTNCPDKALITQYKYNSVPLKIDEDHKQEEVDCSDNWDDTEADDYDPKKYASQAQVIRVHIGDLPSVRKEFRKSERKRLGDEDSSGEDDVEKFRNKVYTDFDCKKNEENRERKWYEDRGPASSNKGNGEEKYEESLKAWSRVRGLDESRGQAKRPIKLEKADDEECSKRKRQQEDDYSLDEDPYYKSNSSGSHQRGKSTSLGISRGAYRKPKY